MAEYYIMLERKYKLPVHQFVIFLGTKKPQMPTRLDRENLKFDFPLISFATLDYRLFLRSDRPEDVLLSILANFGGDNVEFALHQIIQRVEETSQTDFMFKRHFNQLRVLAQLRKLGVKLDNTMDSILPFIKDEDDVLYIRGERKAKERFVRNLLTKMNLTVEQAADVVGVSVEFVEEVRQKMADKP